MPNSNRFRFALRFVLGIIVTTVLLGWLFRNMDWAQLGGMFKHMTWRLALIGLGIVFLLQVVRSARFVVFAPKTPFLTMLSITAVHTFMLRIMPARTGELVYAFLVKRAGTAGFGESLVSLLLLRILDATVVIVIFAVALAFNRGIYLGDPLWGMIIAGLLVLLGTLAIVFFHRLLRFGLRIAKSVLQLLGLHKKPTVHRIFSRLGEVVASSAKIPSAVMSKAVIYTAAHWLVIFALIYWAMRAFYIPVGLGQVVLGGTAVIVSSFLPVSAVGSFGILEAGWAMGFTLVGLESGTAAASGVAFSVITLVYAALLASVGWILLAVLGRQEHGG
ncbi:MAG: lysylphosphatidylglycerol synthase transmembrane domain-containing protein [Pseudomonadota bacterium]